MPPLGWVFPLGGGRCVRLVCPLRVALLASLPCLSLLPHSGATCSSARTGALDWRWTVEGAAVAWTVPTAGLEVPSLKEIFQGGENLSSFLNGIMKKNYVHELLFGTLSDATITCM